MHSFHKLCTKDLPKITDTTSKTQCLPFTLPTDRNPTLLVVGSNFPNNNHNSISCCLNPHRSLHQVCAAVRLAFPPLWAPVSGAGQRSALAHPFSTPSSNSHFQEPATCTRTRRRTGSHARALLALHGRYAACVRCVAAVRVPSQFLWPPHTVWHATAGFLVGGCRCMRRNVRLTVLTVGLGCVAVRVLARFPTRLYLRFSSHPRRRMRNPWTHALVPVFTAPTPATTRRSRVSHFTAESTRTQGHNLTFCCGFSQFVQTPTFYPSLPQPPPNNHARSSVHPHRPGRYPGR